MLCSARIDRDDAWLTEWATSVAMAMHRAEADMRYVRTYVRHTYSPVPLVRPTGEYRTNCMADDGSALHCAASVFALSQFYSEAQCADRQALGRPSAEHEGLGSQDLFVDFDSEAMA